MPVRKVRSSLDAALLETAQGLHRAGVVQPDTLRQISRRVVGAAVGMPLKPLSAIEIRHLRENEGLTKEDFAAQLNLSPSQIDRLERGLSKPTGATAKLLDVIKRKGLSAIR